MQILSEREQMCKPIVLNGCAQFIVVELHSHTVTVTFELKFPAPFSMSDYTYIYIYLVYSVCKCHATGKSEPIFVNPNFLLSVRPFPPIAKPNLKNTG